MKTTTTRICPVWTEVTLAFQIAVRETGTYAKKGGKFTTAMGRNQQDS